jgi:arsenate reductase
MAEVTVLHNKACSTSRFALDESTAAGVDVAVVEYLKEPLDRDALLQLVAQLEDLPADLVRKDSYVRQLGLDETDYQTPEAVADLLVEHPRLMQRPVLVRDGRAIIGRPKDRVTAFLAPLPPRGRSAPGHRSR